jgi:co-chaperonin GroES (HSP10)
LRNYKRYGKVTTINYNRSGLIPKAHAVLLLPFEPDLYGKKSIIIVPQSAQRGLKALEARGVVVAIGKGAWAGEVEQRAVLGEKVMTSKYGGSLIQGEKDSIIYRMVNAGDIYCGIENDTPFEEIYATALAQVGGNSEYRNYSAAG